MHKHEDDCPACSSLGKKLQNDIIAGLKPSDGAVLEQWPIQIKLIGTVAPFLNGAELLVAADCTAFAVKDFHERFLGKRKLLIGCPKLDGAPQYMEKFTEIFSNMDIRGVTCLRMEVPCCGGMTAILKEAIKRSGRQIPLEEIIIGVKGSVLSERMVES